MAINSDTDIHIALVQLGKNANFYRLDQNVVPHKIIDWSSSNKDSQPTDDELNTAYATWKTEAAAIAYKSTRQPLYPSLGDFADAMYWNSKGDSSKLTAYYEACEKVKSDNPKPS